MKKEEALPDFTKELQVRGIVHSIVNGQKHPHVAITELLELIIRPRTFTLQEALEIWDKGATWGFEDAMDGVNDVTNKEQYFKAKFGIDVK